MTYNIMAASLLEPGHSAWAIPHGAVDQGNNGRYYAQFGAVPEWVRWGFDTGYVLH